MQDCYVGQAWTRYNYALLAHNLCFQTTVIPNCMHQHRNWVQRFEQTHVWQNMYCCALFQHTMCSAGWMAIYTSRCYNYEQMKALLTYFLLFTWPHHCSHGMEGLHEWLPPIHSIFSLASLYKVLKMCYIKFWNIWETIASYLSHLCEGVLKTKGWQIFRRYGMPTVTSKCNWSIPSHCW